MNGGSGANDVSAGLIAHRQGDHIQAAALLRQAAESPGATAFHCLSHAEPYCKSVDHRAAIAAARHAVALGETSVLAWFWVGNVLLESREFEQSRDCVEQALHRDPAFWQGRANLAVVRARPGAVAEGIEEFRLLLLEQPNNAELHGNYAALLQGLGQFEHASLEARSAVSLQPDILEHHLRISEIDSQGAPALAEAWCNCAYAKSHVAADPDIDAMERLLQAHAPYHDRLLLHFALARGQSAETREHRLRCRRGVT